MNYHFTTTLAHIEINGGKIAELYGSEAMKIKSDNPFKGNIDPDKLEDFIHKSKPENIPFIRMEASTNLIGGQPFSLQNMKVIRKIADKYGLLLVLDASLMVKCIFYYQRERNI